MTGIYWVIIIFVLQAVIAALAKRAQKNAESQAPRGRPGSSPSSSSGSGSISGSISGSGAGQPFQRADPTKATNPMSSAVLPPRPTNVERAPGASATMSGASTSSNPNQPRATSFKVVRPTAVNTGGASRGGAKPVVDRRVDQQGKKSPSTAGARAQRGVSAKTPPKVAPNVSTNASTSMSARVSASVAPSLQPSAMPRPTQIPAEREEADAMSSRAKVAQSVAKIRSIESSVSGKHVTGLGGTHKPTLAPSRIPTPGAAALGAAPGFSAARIAEVFRNPQRIREAIILSEVIGPPRGSR